MRSASPGPRKPTPSRVLVALSAPDQPVTGASAITLAHQSAGARLRKVTRNRGQFPSGQAALRVLYLAVRNLEEFRGRNVGIRSSGCHHQSRD